MGAQLQLRDDSGVLMTIAIGFVFVDRLAVFGLLSLEVAVEKIGAAIGFRVLVLQGRGGVVSEVTLLALTPSRW